MSHFVVGLTGGIGSGKTTIANQFIALDVDVIDADVIARDVVAPGLPAYKAIVDYFGSTIVSDTQQLDRTKLRQLVFDDNEKKAWLNNLLHPIIREEMIHQCQQATSIYCLLAIPLLVENRLFSLVDQVLVVDIDETLQLERAATRDNAKREEIKKIMASQVSREERLKHATQIINNNGTSDDIALQVDKLHKIYTKLAKSKAKA
jgi:dephospho-CoA kinase